MNNTKKMVLVPYQDGGDDDGHGDMFVEKGGPPFPSNPITNEPTPDPKKGNSIRRYAAERQQKLLLIILKLAQYGGYDESGRFKSSNGEAIDVVPLLAHAASPGRNVKGMSDFIDLLYAARVPADLIINVNVREALIKRYSTSEPSPKRPVRKVPDNKPDNIEPIIDSAQPSPPPPLQSFPPPPPPMQLMVPEDDPRVSQEDRKRLKRKRMPDYDDDDRNVKHKGTIWDDHDSDLDG